MLLPCQNRVVWTSLRHRAVIAICSLIVVVAGVLATPAQGDVRPLVFGQAATMAQEGAADPAAPLEDSSEKPAPAAEGQPASTPSANDDHQDHDHAAGKHDEAGHAEHGDDHADHPQLGKLLPRWTVLPFAALLLCIAIFPLANPHWWEHNSSKAIIVALLAIPVGLYLASFGETGLHALEHVGQEYISFLLLLGSLFVISGGIYVRGTLKGSPFVNTVFLALGAAIASFVGTTGASMLLIRPLLRANEKRRKVAHIVVFFIFIVSNCGGLLTPLGDPPLFLGFLKGVPFEWTFRLLPQWGLVNAVLLALFFVYDSIVLAMDPPIASDPVVEKPEPFGLFGLHNFVFLGGVIAVIYCSGQGLFNGGKPWTWGVGEGLMAVLLVVSYLMTSSSLREKNRFTFAPIIEVAVLFIGIFITMIPALAILGVEGKNLGVSEPWQYFWASGILSSFLDNAPTYLTFAVTASGIQGIQPDGTYLKAFLALPPEARSNEILAAISCGAVFMGANTYIGNGPNFMVKAIAEENNVRMPGFFGYMVYSGLILIPVFVLVTFVFFR